MYGKHFESMYTGSMVGSGAVAFAVWGYVISNQKPPSFDVELNPTILATILGETSESVTKCIEKFCLPDPKSRTREEEGRKLIKLGEYLYHVVNGLAYHTVRTHEQRKQKWRANKAIIREAKKAEPKKPDQMVEVLPERLNHPEFIEAWDSWHLHLKQKRHPATPLARKQQLKKLEAWGLRRAVDAIHRSIEGNWRGIFEGSNSISGTAPNHEKSEAELLAEVMQ